MNTPAQGARRGFASAVWAAIAAANLLPAVLLFYFVRRFGRDVPLWDEWDSFIGPLVLRDRGTLTLADLFAQHNEHRIPFPRMISLANATLFHWDRRVEMYLTGVLLVCAAGMLYAFTRRYWGNRRAAAYFIPAAWILLSWRQFANLLTGFQTAVGLMVAGTVAAFCLLGTARGAGSRIWCAAGAAFVATFSFGAGVFLWPIGLLQLAIRQAFEAPADKPGRSAMGIWTTAGVLIWILYFYGYHGAPVAWPHGMAYVLEHPVLACEFSATLMGAPLSFDMDTARAIGVVAAILAACAVYAMARRPAVHLAAAGPLLSLVLLMPLWAGTLCLGRLGLGLMQALASRYTSVTALGLVAVYALLVESMLASPRTANILAGGGMLALLVIGALTGYTGRPENHEWRLVERAIRMGEYALPRVNRVNDAALKLIHPLPEVVRGDIPILRSHGYSIFHQVEPAGLPARYAGESGACAIDKINDSPDNPIEIHRGVKDDLVVAGWAIEAPGGQLPARVYISLDGTLDFPAMVGDIRADVAGALHDERDLNAGFASYPRADLIPAGEHVLSLKVVSHDGSVYRTCSQGTRIVSVVE
jgi:hypothetical protein